MTQEDIYRVHATAMIFSIVEELSEQFNIDHVDALNIVVKCTKDIDDKTFRTLGYADLADLKF